MGHTDHSPHHMFCLIGTEKCFRHIIIQLYDTNRHLHHIHQIGFPFSEIIERERKTILDQLLHILQKSLSGPDRPGFRDLQIDPPGIDFICIGNGNESFCQINLLTLDNGKIHFYVMKPKLYGFRMPQEMTDLLENSFTQLQNLSTVFRYRNKKSRGHNASVSFSDSYQRLR